MGEAPGADTFHLAVEAYDRHVGRYSDGLARELAAFAGVAAGDRALDVGCGPGGLTRVLAEVVGAANVVAVDPSEPFLELCRKRVPGAHALRGSAEDLPVEEASFDAVLAQLVVNFLADAPAGVRSMRRAARPGGTVAACVWDYAGEMTLLRAFWDAALELDPEAPDEGRTMRWCSTAELAELWRAARLADVATTELRVEVRYAGFDDLWAPFPQGIAPSGAYCASLPPDRQEALRAAMHRRLGGPDGPFALGARAWAVRGRV